VTTTVVNIKKIEGECTKPCEERAQIWTDLVDDSEMKDIDSKIREAWE
jgi:hypothetical protein